MSHDEPIKILVVDDNPATLYSTSRILRASGFEVIEAATGREALTRVEEDPALVVLDVNLPDTNGFEICKTLRGREKTARLPVLHLSATFVKDSDKVHGLRSGADGYLTHPVEPPVLIATINAFLRARQAEDAMRKSEAKFRAVFDQALNGISLLSEDLVYLEVNPAMCRMLERKAREIVGKHLSAFMPPTKESTVIDITALLAAHGRYRGTFPLIRAGGRQIELDWSISIHSVPGVRLAIVTDITERKHIEAERERLLSSEQAARAEAERANRLKDDFLAVLSHELRTPLNAIVGWAQLLKRGSAREPLDLEKGLETIERNARIQAQLIEDLLDVSRITSGKLHLDIQNIDPAKAIHAALDNVMPAAHAKELELRCDISPDIGTVAWDPARLQQVVWNLVNNAVKFTPRHGRIEIKLERTDTTARLSVSDNGHGIPREFLPHIFDRFSQADASKRRGHGGLGLGLAIVKHLVEMHGGTVAAESPGEGQGATFTVEFPVISSHLLPMNQKTDAVRHEREFPDATDGASEVRDLNGIRVLVVDDDPDSRALARRVLTAAHAEVSDAANVPQALDFLPRFQPHVLISDLAMPGLDGFDLIREARAKGYDEESLPAIALTALARESDRREVLSAGYQKHLPKPVDAGELVAVTAALAGRS